MSEAREEETITGCQSARAASPMETSTNRRNVVRGMIGTSLGALLLHLGLDPQSTAASTTAGIAEVINEYRMSQGLPAIPVSVELTAVAKAHTADLVAHSPEDACNGNLHSWSPNGNWSSGCYDPNDDSTWPMMWNKPREITDYPGNGYEISAAYSSPEFTIDAEFALELWKDSPPHNNVILNQGIWADHPWRAIGGWIENQHACTWFGEEPGTPPTEEPPVTNPPGTLNPTFTGSRATITNAIDSPNTGTANRVRDNNVGTNWSTAQNYPTAASLTIDLGSSIKLTGIKWRWSNINYGDQFDVRVATSLSGPWSTVGRFGNGTSTTAWFGATTGHTGRFVQFLFTNPNHDAVLGAISEVEIWRQSTVVNPPGTRNPVIPGEKIRLTNAFDSPNTGNANKVRDGSHSTNWATAQNRPAAASVTVDLGASTRITGIRWLWTNINYADQFDLQVAASVSGPWTTIGRFGNGTATYTWFGTTANATGRFVRFAFGNPNRDLVLGALGEIEVFKPSVTVNPPGIQNPNVGSFFKQPVTNVFDSPNTGTAGRVKDGTAYTNWAVQGRPTTASITLDMGSVRAVNTIRWMMSSIGYADQFQVRVATSYGSWSNLGTFGNPTATNTWFGIELASARSARFVQLAFTNPNGDPALGAVGEIEIWGGTPAAAARANPLFAGSALEIEHTEVNGGEIVGDGGTSVSIAADRPETVTTVLETTTNNGLTGVRWMSGAGIAVTVSTSADSSTWTRVASVITVDSGSAWQGVILQSAADTRFVRIEARPGSSTSAPHLNDVEIWGMEIDVATAEASPDAVTPIASEEAPDATPLQPTAEPTHEIPATDDPTEQPATPVATNAPTETPTEEPTATDEPTEIPTDVPTEEPTVAPTEAPPTQPLTIVDTGDTENSGTAWNAQDDDPSTVWTVYPSAETSQVRLYVDLGSVQPIGGLSFTLRTWDQLPAFEIWLSEDAVTWFNVTPGGINGWNLPRDEAITLDLGYNARYVRIVVPNVHQTGLGQIGGIDDLQVWPGESTQTARLTNAFAPTTPIPVTIPTEEVLPTGEPTVEEAIPTEEPVIEEPTEEVIPTEEPTVEVIAEPTDVPTEVVVGEPTEDLPAEEIPPADEPTEEAVG